ncbi:MAG TPA: DUF2934 domain-containing protein [Chthoniobacterales bacterium]
MPRKTKTNETEKNGANTPSVNSESKKRRSAAKRLMRKKPAVSARRPKPTANSIALTSAAEPSDDMIRTRAYFIAERRHRLGLLGDASSDWLEAKRQLLSELGPR